MMAYIGCRVHGNVDTLLFLFPKYELIMALCVPKVMILGHSFVKRLHKDMENHFDDRAKSNFNLEGIKVRLFGIGGRTVEKIKKFDLNNVRCYSPDVVILEVGSNDLNKNPPQSVGSEIDDLANLLINKFSVRIVVICLVIPRIAEVFNEKVSIVNQYLKVVIDHPNMFIWRHKGLYQPNMLLADGVHLNGYGQYALYRSYRGAILKAMKIIKELDF